MHNKKPTSNNSDNYETPSYVWDLILKYIPRTLVIYEPFFLNGNSGAYITSKGYKCIHKNTDFFKNDVTLSSYDIIVSNPPFSKRKEIFEKLKELNKPFALIVPLQTLVNTYFKTLFNNNVQIIIPKTRIGFIQNDVWTNRSDFDSVILTHNLNLPQDIIFESEIVPRPPNIFYCPHCTVSIKMRGKASHIKGKQHLINAS